MLRPEAEARVGRSSRVMGDHIHLGVVEQRCSFRLAEPSVQPLVVDDRDLSMNVDGIRVVPESGRKSRRGRARSSSASISTASMPRVSSEPLFRFAGKTRTRRKSG